MCAPQCPCCDVYWMIHCVAWKMPPRTSSRIVKIRTFCDAITIRPLSSLPIMSFADQGGRRLFNSSCLVKSIRTHFVRIHSKRQQKRERERVSSTVCVVCVCGLVDIEDFRFHLEWSLCTTSMCKHTHTHTHLNISRSQWIVDCAMDTCHMPHEYTYQLIHPTKRAYRCRIVDAAYSHVNGRIK